MTQYSLPFVVIIYFCANGEWVADGSRSSAFPGFRSSVVCHSLHMKDPSGKIKKVPASDLKKSVHGLEKIPGIIVKHSFKICCITSALGRKNDIVGENSAMILR